MYVQFTSCVYGEHSAKFEGLDRFLLPLLASETLFKRFCWFKTFWNSSFSNFLIVKFKSVTASVILSSLCKLNQSLHNEDKTTDAVTDLNFTIRNLKNWSFKMFWISKSFWVMSYSLSEARFNMSFLVSFSSKLLVLSF